MSNPALIKPGSALMLKSKGSSSWGTKELRAPACLKKGVRNINREI